MKRRDLKGRVLAVIMAVTMAMGNIPITALAEEPITESYAQEMVVESEEVRENEEITQAVEENMALTDEGEEGLLTEKRKDIVNPEEPETGASDLDTETGGTQENSGEASDAVSGESLDEDLDEISDSAPEGNPGEVLDTDSKESLDAVSEEDLSETLDTISDEPSEEDPDAASEEKREISQDDTEKFRISAWEWTDASELENNTIHFHTPVNSGGGRRKAAAKAISYSFEYIVSRLPQTISVTVDGESVEIPVTWRQEDSDYVQDADGNWPQTGTYTFAASLPAEYELGDQTPPIKITVVLGDDVIMRPGLTSAVKWGSNRKVLTEEGIDLVVARDTTFDLELSFGFPEGSSEKQVDITAAYGLSWNADNFGGESRNLYFNSLSHAEHWYTQLKSGGLITPEQNGDMTVWYGHKCFDGTLTLKYEDSTDAIEIIDYNTNNMLHLTTYAGYISAHGLNQIGGTAVNEDALKVRLSYSLEGRRYSVEKKIHKITFATQIDHLVNGGGWNSDTANLNKSGQSQVNENQLASNAAYWNTPAVNAAGTNLGLGNESTIDSFFLALEMPKDILMSSCPVRSYPSTEPEPPQVLTYSTTETTTYQGDAAIITEDGTVTLPDGASYTITDPDKNKLVVVSKSARFGTVRTSGGWYFGWSFPEAKAGDIFEITAVHSGVIYHNTQGQWISGDNRSSRTYLIIPEEEEVFVNVSYTNRDKVLSGSNSGDWVWVPGIGAPGVKEDHIRQEFLLGGVNIGNRGLGDSVPKKITIYYDDRETNYCGVTMAYLKYLKNDMANLTVKLINMETKEVFSQEVSEEYISSVVSRGYVHRKDFTEDDNVYLKEISYEVSTINKRTANGKNNSNDDYGREATFYGYVLTNQFAGSDANNYRAKVTVSDVTEEGQDPIHPPITGYSIVTLTNQYTVNNARVSGTATMGVATKDNRIGFLYGFYNTGYYYTGIATYIDELYMISPYGDELRDFRIVSSKDSAKTLEITEDMLTSVKIADADYLKLSDQYKNGILYKIDLTGLTEDEDIYYFRMGGVARVTGPEQRAHSYNGTAGWIGTVYCTTDVAATDPVGSIGNILYVRPHLPRTADGTDDLSRVTFGGVYSSNVKDALVLSGNANNKLFGGASWQLKGTDNLLVTSSAKMSPEPDTLYRTWTGTVDTYVGANSDINYRITVINTTNLDVPGMDLYVPVPKKGDQWNLPASSDTKFIQNESGEFEINMDLLGAGISRNEGFTITYASAAPSAVSGDWESYNWMSADQVSDWSAINFIHISSNRAIPMTTQEVFDFTLRAYPEEEKTGGYTEADVNAHKRNIWAPYFQNVYGAAIVHGIGEPVATILAPGIVAGTVWRDTDVDGYIDGDERTIAGHRVELYRVGSDGSESLSQTVNTDRDGRYLFKGLLPGQNFKVVVEKSSEDIFTTRPDDYRSIADSMKFDTISGDTASVRTDVTPDTTDQNSQFNLNLNCGVAIDIPYVFLNVSKEWNDGNNAEGTRPESVTVLLLADGVDTGKSLVLNADNDWQDTFTGLPQYDDEEAEIEYTVSESGMTDYLAEVTGSVEDGYTITNTPKTDITVEKHWDDAEDQDGIRPDSVSVQLLADGEKKGPEVVLDETNDWSYTWEELDKYSAGTKIEYTVEEISIEEYETVIEEDIEAENGRSYTVTNIHVPYQTSVTVNKVWEDEEDYEGLRPDSIQVRLWAQADGTVIDLEETREDVEVTLTAQTGWSYTWEKLDKNAAGVEISYTLEEIPVEGYETEIAGSADQGYIITNTHEVEYKTVDGVVIWDDLSDEDRRRPASVVVTLFADGEEAARQTVELAGSAQNTADNWNFSFTELAVYRKGYGKTEAEREASKIEYTVTQNVVNEYETNVKKNQMLAYNGPGVSEKRTAGTAGTAAGETESWTVLNYHRVPTTTVTVNKAWNDNDNAENLRPESITVRLLADGEETGQAVLDGTSVNADGNWTYTFENLPVRRGGQEITYTVTEDMVRSYTLTSIDGNAQDGFTITNTQMATIDGNVGTEESEPGKVTEAAAETETEPLPTLDGDQATEKVTEKTTEKETETETEKEKVTDTVKTGDETPLTLWIAILMAALLVIAGTGAVMRRKRRDNFNKE